MVVTVTDGFKAALLRSLASDGGPLRLTGLVPLLWRPEVDTAASARAWTRSHLVVVVTLNPPLIRS